MKLLTKLFNKSQHITDAANYATEYIKSELRRKPRYEVSLAQFKYALSSEFNHDFTDKELTLILRLASENVYSSGIRILCDINGVVASKPLSLGVKES